MNHIYKSLGPGLIYAGAAIGVSHLVQSTRAGASMGWFAVIIVLLVHLLKYPFFEIGPRYAQETNTSLLSSYREKGIFPFSIFLTLTLSTMFIVQAAVTLVTAGILSTLWPNELSLSSISIGILLLSALLIYFGSYKALDQLMKIVILLLTASTFIAVSLAFGQSNLEVFTTPVLTDLESMDVLFLAAFIGWMPAPFDISVWHSSWTLEKKKLGSVTLKSTLRDFHIGYWTTCFLACLFVMLGTLVLNTKGNTMPNGAIPFIQTLIQSYTDTLGKWAYYPIGIAALTTMFSTTLAVTDGYTRVMSESLQLLNVNDKWKKKAFHQNTLLIILIFGAIIVLIPFGGQLKLLVDFAATVSFLTAPILCWFNLKAFQDLIERKLFRPSPLKMMYIWMCFVTLLGFTFWYFWVTA